MGTFLVQIHVMQAQEFSNPDSIVLDVMKKHAIVELGASGCQGCDPCCCYCFAGLAAKRAHENNKNNDEIRASDAIDESIGASMKSMTIRAIFFSLIIFIYGFGIITMANAFGRSFFNCSFLEVITFSC